MPSVLLLKRASLFLLVIDFLKVNFPNFEYEKFMQIDEGLTLGVNNACNFYAEKVQAMMSLIYKNRLLISVHLPIHIIIFMTVGYVNHKFIFSRITCFKDDLPLAFECHFFRGICLRKNCK